MAFYFGEKEGDELMSKINLRDISSRAKQWDNPINGLFKYADSIKKCGGNILKLSKKERELYCISLVALAMKSVSQVDWWTNIPNHDPPDGLIMTLIEEKPDNFKGGFREIEVVEHRDKPEKIFGTIRDKMIEKYYEPNTILVCLVLSPSVYNFKVLSTELKKITSSIKHVFVVFAGISLAQGIPTPKCLQSTFTMVQLLPIFEETTFDLLPHLEDFKNRYNKGQELRLIEESKIYFGTRNQNFKKISPN